MHFKLLKLDTWFGTPGSGDYGNRNGKGELFSAFIMQFCVALSWSIILSLLITATCCHPADIFFCSIIPVYRINFPF